MNIFHYWSKEGNPMNPGLILCLEALRKNNPEHNIIILDEDNVKDYCDLLPNWKDQKDVIKRSDYLRVEAIYKNGGIWLDSDILALQNLNQFWNRAINDPDGVSIHGDAFFASQAKTPFISQTRDIIRQIYFNGSKNLLSKSFREVRKRNPKWRHHVDEMKEKVYIYDQPNHTVKDFTDIMLVIFFFTHRSKYKQIWNAFSPFDSKSASEVLDSHHSYSKFFKAALFP